MKIYHYLFFALILFGCNNTTEKKTKAPSYPVSIKLFDDGQILSLDLSKATFRIKTAPWLVERTVCCSELFDSLWYVPLETNDNCIIGSITKVLFTDEEFIIIDRKTKRILRFSEKGDFLNQIGDIGRGPREYVVIGDIECHGKGDNGHLYIGTFDKLLHYRLNGVFVESIPLIGRQEYIIIDTSSIAVAQDISSGNAPYRLVIQNFRGDTLQKFPNYLKFERPKTTISNSALVSKFSRYKGEIYYKFPYSDTVFLINGNKLEPRYIIDLGKFKRPDDWIPEKGLHPVADYSKHGFYQFSFEVQEMDKYLYINIFSAGRFGGYEMSFLYDISIDSTLSVKSAKVKDKTYVNGFENDFDGGQPLIPEWISGEYTIGLFTYINSTIQYPDIIKDKYKSKTIRAQMENIIKNHDENDNPVLIVARNRVAK